MELLKLLCFFFLMKTCMANEPYCRQYDYDEKLLTKMIRTEIALESLTREMKTMESAFESKIRQVTEMGSDLETKLRQVTEDLVNKVQAVSSRPVRSEVEAVGFTARDPHTSKSNNSLIIFNTIETNVGDGYNEKTGKFRCKIPGFYFFIAVILRDRGSTSSSYCHIRVNDKSTVYAYAHSKDSSEHPSGAAHLTVQLKEEDEVYLGNCRGVDRFDHSSHFSGFMISHA